MKEDIDRFAEQAGFPARRAFSDLSDLYPRLERFAALVRADEHKRLLALMKQTHDAYALSSYPSGFKPKDDMPLFDDWDKDWK